MIDYKTQDKFDKLYNETHRDILKYIVLNCYNLEDAKDILQSTYLEVYKKKEVVNHKKYIVGIAKNKIKRFYRFKYKIKNMFLYNEEISTIDNVSSDYNLEESIFMKYDVDLVWKLISKKPAVVSKVIYLYYYEGYTIKEISSILNISESNVKHYIYRTINELNIRGV